MEIIRRLSKIKKKHKNGILTIGTFDGVHLGHQAIIKNVINRARSLNRKSVVLTLYPNPMEVFGSGGQSINILEEKIKLIEDLGADVLVILKFTRKLASISPQQFIIKVLLRLVPFEVVVGSNHTFGRGGKGRPWRLRKFGRIHHFKVSVLKLKRCKGRLVNSTGIRALIKQGDTQEARTKLGRHFSLSGKVVRGRGRGRILGFPTANLKVHPYKILPGNGVYSVYVNVDGKRHRGIVNVGYCPTFGKGLRYPRIEVFIIGFRGKLYGRVLKVEFAGKIRDEKSFSGIEALRAQIKKDLSKIDYAEGRFDGSGKGKEERSDSHL